MTDRGRWPLTIVRRGERVGSDRPDYVWWQELPAEDTPESVRSLGYEVVEVVPASRLEQPEPVEQPSTRNVVSPEQAEINRERPGSYTFNAFPPDDYEGVLFVVAALRLGDHAHVEWASGRAGGSADSIAAGKGTTLHYGKAGNVVYRWHEWLALREVLDAHPMFRIAEVENPRTGQLDHHGVGSSTGGQR